MPCYMPKTVNFNVLTWLDMSNKKQQVIITCCSYWGNATL